MSKELRSPSKGQEMRDHLIRRVLHTRDKMAEKKAQLKARVVDLTKTKTIRERPPTPAPTTLFKFEDDDEDLPEIGASLFSEASPSSQADSAKSTSSSTKGSEMDSSAIQQENAAGNQNACGKDLQGSPKKEKSSRSALVLPESPGLDPTQPFEDYSNSVSSDMSKKSGDSSVSSGGSDLLLQQSRPLFLKAPTAREYPKAPVRISEKCLRFANSGDDLYQEAEKNTKYNCVLLKTARISPKSELSLSPKSSSEGQPQKIAFGQNIQCMDFRKGPAKHTHHEDIYFETIRLTR